MLIIELYILKIIHRDYVTQRHVHDQNPQQQIEKGELSDMQKIENECMIYALTAKAKQTYKFRVHNVESH